MQRNNASRTGRMQRHSYNHLSSRPQLQKATTSAKCPQALANSELRSHILLLQLTLASRWILIKYIQLLASCVEHWKTQELGPSINYICPKCIISCTPSVTYARNDPFVESGSGQTSVLWYEQEKDSPCHHVPWELNAEVVKPVHDCWLLVTALGDRQLRCREFDP